MNATEVTLVFEMHGIKATKALLNNGLKYYSTKKVEHPGNLVVRVTATWILETANAEDATAEALDCVDVQLLEQHNIDLIGQSHKAYLVK